MARCSALPRRTSASRRRQALQTSLHVVDQGQNDEHESCQWARLSRPIFPPTASSVVPSLEKADGSQGDPMSPRGQRPRGEEGRATGSVIDHGSGYIPLTTLWVDEVNDGGVDHVGVWAGRNDLHPVGVPHVQKLI